MLYEPTQPQPPSQSLQELEHLFPGYTFDSFLERGGMGSVYKARQQCIDRPVAIKILHPELSQNETFRTAFQREAQSMARLNHRNLVTVYDFGESQGHLYIVMQYIEGQSLHQSCEGKALVAEEAAELIASVCRGIEHAHQHQILHRDIKPANILVDQHFQANIIDFGIAETVGTDFGDLKETFCTPDYAAPETAYQGCKLDARTDIFSIGVVFYELLTGRLPGSRLATTAPPSALIDCPPGYDDVVMRAIHPNPDQRYQRAEDLANAIDSLPWESAERRLTQPSSHQGLMTPASGTTSGNQRPILLTPPVSRP